MNLHIKILIIAFLASSNLFAQELDHQLGQILVKVENPQAINQVVRKYAQFRSTKSNIKVAESIIESQHIFLLDFDFSSIDENELLHSIRRNKHVIEAQFNHLVSLRNVPNDPFFTSQWQYIGANGGVDGIDIDADLAWDTTTGGVTVYGDTIVVCVIDKGFDLEHIDFEDNLWINHAEIPNDGIDNDNNGYIDDYKGWNVDTNNDVLAGGGSHGTSVAGIVGAKGNNGIGVTGVSWDVKVMIVSGGGNEAEVLKAYAYPYKMRKLYNDTNGEEGAFVVATNASWGTDGMLASSAPLWCSFYDSLGVIGILSCGATTNSNKNVDVVGDLPTHCSSDYLIAVTNMNKNDVKLTNAGFGVESIDLGAFGEDTYTLSNNNNYKGFGGTSGATPHVAGTIGLLYASPCPDFINLVKSDPAAATLKMKSYILDGVDHNTSLEGITKTEGRLNVNNSLNLLMDECADCVHPFNFLWEFLNKDSIQLSWAIYGDDITSVDLNWRVKGADTWNEVTDVVAPFILDDISSCFEYEFRLRSNCTDIVGIYSKELQIDTRVVPHNFHLITNVIDTIKIGWVLPDIALNGFIIDIYEDESDDPSWSINSDTLVETEYIINDFLDCTNYKIALRSDCPSVLAQKELVFRTKGCGSCLDLDYCKPISNSSEEWIDSLFFGQTIIASGNNDGYNFNDDYSLTIVKGDTFRMTLVPGFSASEFSEKIAVWIDLDRDGDFDDADFLHAAEYRKNDGKVDVKFLLPSEVELGSSRMRIIFSFSLQMTGCEDFDYGEVEDFCVDIVNCAYAVSSLDIAKYETKVDLTWDNSDMVNTYIQYRKVGAVDWIEVSTNTNFLAIENLESCTDYETQFSIDCTDGKSSFTESVIFTTDCESSTSDNYLLSKLSIFPNPVVNEVNIEFLSKTTSESSFTIFDIHGRDLQTINIKINQGRNRLTLPLNSQITSGVYFIQLRNHDFIETLKFVKE